MANIKSQLKRIKTNEKARLRNKAVKSSLKTSVRKFREAASAGERDTALEAMQVASRQLDKAASKGVIHTNQAANRKSAMAKQRRLALGTSRRSAASHEGVTRRGWRPSSSPDRDLSRGTGLRRSRPPPAPGRRPGRCRRP